MIELSATTGLPELPKNTLFWRVGESVNRSYFHWGDTGAYVSIIERQHIQTDTARYIHLPFKLKIPLGFKTEVEDNEAIIVTRFITKTEMVEVDVYDADEVKTGVKLEEQSNHVTSDDLTPDLILAAAIKTLERYHEITKSRGYLGDYPPKTLLVTK